MYKRQGMGESNIDITISSPDLKNNHINWKVTDDRDSDHRVISFCIDITNLIKYKKINENYGKLNLKKTDWCKFLCTIQNKMDEIEYKIRSLKINSTNNRNDKNHLDNIVNDFTLLIKNAASKSIPIIKLKSKMKGLPPFWSN